MKEIKRKKKGNQKHPDLPLVSLPATEAGGTVINTHDAQEIVSAPPPYPKLQTDNMEVHHHAPHRGRKSLKSYFWEFIMLFLAVFCGFLAEYQLEHVIE